MHHRQTASHDNPFSRLRATLLPRRGGKPHSQAEIARALAEAFVDSMAGIDNGTVALHDGTVLPIRNVYQQIIDTVWPVSHAAPFDPQTITDPGLQQACVDFTARLGHIRQMADFMLRDNVLTRARTQSTADAFITGNLGSKQVKPYSSAAAAVRSLSRPGLEFTFTAHPTNTNSLTLMEHYRTIGTALRQWRTDPTATNDLKQALYAFASVPLLPARVGAQPGLSVRDEAQAIQFYLTNTLDSLDETYRSIDKSLHKHFDDKPHLEPYAPETLRLNVRTHAWGSSGDKDGNQRVNADTTLYAVALHHERMLSRYVTELKSCTGLDAWREPITTARDAAAHVAAQMQHALMNHERLSPDAFDAQAQQLQKAVAPLQREAFLKAIETAYEQAEGDAKKPLLTLLRHVHHFGMSFGTIEYRETAEEYTRIVSAMIDGYEAMDETARRASIEAILENPAAITAMGEKLSALGVGAHDKPYTKADVGPIAYHTRKRLELARDFPRAIENHVLAESENASNLLEALLLQHAVAKDGKRATLDLVPLFEDAEPLEKAPSILAHVLQSEPYRDHLDKTAEAHGRPLRQEVQFAHSDNARRNGLPAARALVYRANNRVVDLFAEQNRDADQPIQLQRYQGGSVCDSYRGGGRPISAAINAYGQHASYKTTVQGADGLMCFTWPGSGSRIFTRNITHSAAHLANPQAFPRDDVHALEQPMQDALIETGPRYVSDVFKNPAYTAFLTDLGFAQEQLWGNVSSRANDRDPTAPVSAVNVGTTRTIGFSEGQQHRDLNPSIIGSLPIVELMGKHHVPNDPGVLRHIYRHSPLYKDVTDRLLNGLLSTNLPQVRANAQNHPFLERLEAEYAGAFKLALESYTGKPLEALTGGRTLTPTEQHQLLIDNVYPHMADMIADRDRYLDVVRGMKQQWIPEQADNRLMGTTLHCATDTVTHGRMLVNDDTTYATLYCQQMGVERPFGPVKIHGPAK